MPKPKAPVWLRESFRDGVDENYADICLLAWLDPVQRPCLGRFERFHWISRQRVETALWTLLPGRNVDVDGDLMLLAAWDARNGARACEQHHRRFDSHLTPELKVPGDMLPSQFLDFVYDWGLESELERKFPLGKLVKVADIP